MLKRVLAASLLLVLAVCALYQATNHGKRSEPRPTAPDAGSDARRSTPVEVPSAEHAEPTAESSGQPLAKAHASSPAAAPSSGAGARADWPHGSPCSPEQSADAARVREQSRATFTRVAAPPGRAALYFDPTIAEDTVERLLYALARIEGLINARLGLSSDAPDVYLYRSAAQLRQGVCVSPQTVSYYDGRIHLAIDPNDDLLQSLKHEYTHHALFSHGIRRPVWFQEGAAMLVANEKEWSHWRPKGALLRPAQMVQTFPQTASAPAAEAFYGQAFAMTEFLGKLCEHSSPCDLRDLVRALEIGKVHAEDLFDWAISERGRDLVRTARLPLWDDYASNGMQFGTETATAIRARR